MKATKYTTQAAPKSHCGKCHGELVLLCPEDIPQNKRELALPWFYICWTCQRLSQIGVGEVEEEKE